MELTLKSFTSRLEMLQKLAASDAETLAKTSQALHEKGVECAVIVPLLEVILDFDALHDITYEMSSTVKHGQRFDFLINGKFLIEAKTLGANLDDHHAQIARYIKDNSPINYGILTNGIDFQIWMKRSFVESVVDSPLQHTGVVAKVLELSLEEDGTQFIIDVLSLFNKSHYEQAFRTIASIVGHYVIGGRGRPAILHQDRVVNEKLRDRIRDEVSVKKGVYYESVMSGKMSPGQILCYKDNCVEIKVEVTKTGTVILRRGDANIIDMMAAIQSGWSQMISLIADQWSKADSEFEDPVEIIKRSQNKQRLHGKERFQFVKAQ